MNLKLSVDRVHVEEDKDLAAAGGDMSLAAAIQIIQRNERGRQGKARAVLMKELREEEKQRRCVTVLQSRRRVHWRLVPAALVCGALHVHGSRTGCTT